jgi:hypothetical protein
MDNEYFLQRIQEIKDQNYEFAIKFPASYFNHIFDAEYSKKRLKEMQFVDVLPIDEKGMVYKSAPTDLILEAKKYFESHRVPHSVMILETIEAILRNGEK